MDKSAGTLCTFDVIRTCFNKIPKACFPQIMLNRHSQSTAYLSTLSGGGGLSVINVVFVLDNCHVNDSNCAEFPS